ncbi:guanylate kinase 1 [Gracilaria domingensis]|nr:guanylate kinase 1 [Gracilaria domingensis]
MRHAQRARRTAMTRTTARSVRGGEGKKIPSSHYMNTHESSNSAPRPERSSQRRHHFGKMFRALYLVSAKQKRSPHLPAAPAVNRKAPSRSTLKARSHRSKHKLPPAQSHASQHGGRRQWTRRRGDSRSVRRGQGHLDREAPRRVPHSVRLFRVTYVARAAPRRAERRALPLHERGDNQGRRGGRKVHRACRGSRPSLRHVRHGGGERAPAGKDLHPRHRRAGVPLRARHGPQGQVRVCGAAVAGGAGKAVEGARHRDGGGHFDAAGQRAEGDRGQGRAALVRRGCGQRQSGRGVRAAQGGAQGGHRPGRQRAELKANRPACPRAAPHHAASRARIHGAGGASDGPPPPPRAPKSAAIHSPLHRAASSRARRSARARYTRASEKFEKRGRENSPIASTQCKPPLRDRHAGKDITRARRDSANPRPPPRSPPHK